MEEMKFNTTFNPQSMMINSFSSENKPTPNEINIIKESIKIASLESSKMNCYLNEELTVTYVMTPDTSLNSNISVNQSNWIVEEGDDNV